MRLTLALEATVEEQLSALRAGNLDGAMKNPFAADRDQPWVRHHPFPGDFSSPRRNTIRDSVFDIVDREVTDICVAHDILESCHERLTEDERHDVLVRLPLREAVAAICEYVHYQPNWSLWTDDGWPPSPVSPRQIWDRFWPSPGAQQKRQLQ